MTKVLVTGSAGFIGFHVCRRMLEDGHEVTGVDAMTEYYDLDLKKRREEILKEFPHFRGRHDFIETPGFLSDLFSEEKPEIVVHLAAQAGVRHSIENPRAYLDSNIVGTFELLEAARSFPPAHMLLASSSSVYGGNTSIPYRETDLTDHQMSFYAASKKANESMAHSYAHLFNLPITMFRFFTVYGPWGRPDMALFKFTKAILEGNPIDVYNRGNMSRDFTYIDDLVRAICLLVDVIPTRPEPGSAWEGDSLSPTAPWRIVNIGNSQSVRLTEFIEAIEDALGMPAKKNLMPMQPGDVPATWADAGLLKSLTGYEPRTSISDGIERFVDWYRSYYGS